MSERRAERLFVCVLTSALVTATVSQMNADVIFFANGRTMSVKDHRISGDTVTVTLGQGGEATFATSLISRIAPSEIPDPPTVPAVPSAVVLPAGLALEARPFAELIETVALSHGIDPALVHAVVEAESNYRPTAKSAVGARGLMQVMSATGRDLGVTSAATLFDPRANLEAGVQYLKRLLERFNGDLSNALAAYNAGPAAVLRYRGVPPYQETENYVKKVLANFQP